MANKWDLDGFACNTKNVPYGTVFTVATLPSAQTAGIIYVSNGAAGSPVLAFSDGTNWKRSDTLANVSAS
ncbi:MAG: hypothetical protein ACYSWP_11485 [Planctomycetota bacterium]|jgi:hypothetical protein